MLPHALSTPQFHNVPLIEQAPAAADGGRGGFAFLGRSLRRHWRSTILLSAALSAALIGGIAALPKSYSASAYLMIDSRAHVVNIQEVTPGLGMDVEGLSSELEILRSRDLIKTVAKRLPAAELPLTATDPPPASPLLRRIKEWAAPLKAKVAAPPLPLEERVLAYLLSHSDVKPLGKSRVIEIRFTASNPDTARDAANAFADAFIAGQIAEKSRVSIAAKQWVDGEIERMRGQVQANERKLEEFRTHNGMTEDGNKQLLPFTQVAELEHHLTEAQAQYAATRGRVDEVRRLLHSGSLMSGLPETLGSASLQVLRAREAKLTVDRATLLQQYGPDSERIRRLDGELAELRGTIRQELTHIADGLTSEAAMAANEVASLQGSVTGAKNRLESHSDHSVTLLSLTREVEAGRDLLVTLMKRQFELASQASMQTADAHIVSAATTPRQPAFPRLIPMSLLALLGSALAAAGFNLSRDLRDRSLRSAEEIAALVPFQPLGMLPRFTPSRRPRHLEALTKDRSRFAEAVKNVYFQIVAQNQPLPRSIVVTSPLPGDGKTTSAVSLALLAASLGRKVVLVDFDPRRPSVHHILRLPLGPGMMDYMAGKVDGADALLRHPLPETPLSVITAGRGADFNVMLRSERLESLMAELTARFDHVIIDTPPSLAVVDPLVVARLADRVVQVVRWSKTSHETLRAMANLFDGIDPARIGVVIAQVDVERHAADGYADSAIYQKSLNRYYLG